MVRKDVFLSWAFSYGQIIFTNGPLMYIGFDMFFWLKVAYLGSCIAKKLFQFLNPLLKKEVGKHQETLEVFLLRWSVSSLSPLSTLE